MVKRTVIELEVNGNTGIAEVSWIPTDQYNVAHYGAFISVPYQSSRWVHLFIHNKSDLDGAIAKAKDYLQSALERCTLC